MRYTLLALILTLFSVPSVKADFETTPVPVSPGGVPAIVDIPPELHIRNIGGRDGSGLCVGTSVEVAARWQNVIEMDGFQKWLAKYPGGSYPEQLARDLPAFCKSKGVPVPQWIQHTGGDDAFLDLVFKTRRAAGITYAGHDNFYTGTIAHMVTAAHLDKEVGAIIDNNRPKEWVWMTRKEMLARWKGLDDRGNPYYIGGRFARSPVGGGWCVVFLGPPPPPYPPRVGDQCPCGPGCKCSPCRCSDSQFVKADVPTDGWVEVQYEAGPIYFYWQGGEVLFVWKRGEWFEPIPGKHDAWFSTPIKSPLGFKPPFDPGLPKPLRIRVEDLPTGVDPARLRHPTPRYWINGTEVSRDIAFAAVLSDDSDRAYLSVVLPTSGKEGLDARKSMINRITKDPQWGKYADRVHLQVYLADAPMVKGRIQGDVVLQDPTGRVVKTGFTATLPTVFEVLSAMDPKAPEPAPAPRPVDPTPPPRPVDPPKKPIDVPAAPVSPSVPVTPTVPEPAPASLPNWIVAALAVIATLLFTRKA